MNLPKAEQREGNAYLIGTIHTDPFLKKRLERALNYFRPKSITLECTPEMTKQYKNGIDYFEIEDFADILNDKEKDELRQIMQVYGSEITVPLQCAPLIGAQTYPVDTKVTTVKPVLNLRQLHSQIQGVQHTWAAGRFLELEALLYSEIDDSSSQDLREIVARALAFVYTSKKYWKEVISYHYRLSASVNTTGSSQYERDQHMAGQIIDIWNSTEGDLMHIGGMAHIFGQQTNLYDLLRDAQLHPTRLKLTSFDNKKYNVTNVQAQTT